MFKKISNVSRTLVINTFQGFYYGDDSKINNAIESLSKSYEVSRLRTIARKIAKSVGVEVLNESTHSFNPFGDSASFLVEADLKSYNNGVFHLKESHITFHTYIEDTLENFLIIRFELHICSCAEENIFLALPEVFHHSLNLPRKRNFLLPHLIVIDYLKRGSDFRSSYSNTANKDHLLTDTVSNEAFGNNYIFLKKIEDSNNKQYILTMKEDLIKNYLQSSSKGVPNDACSKFIESLNKEYIKPFL
tara:strand:+ start:425 stop:1165 length:741 start_codon:yes stop_codon:yes gene_type:complete